jgi:hypothetical protein
MRQCVGVLVMACALNQATAGTAYPQAPSPVREFSCEVFPQETGEAELVARYGRDNVRLAGVVGWDDGPQDGAIVFPDQQDLKLEIIWANPGKTISSIRAVGRRWRSPEGISVGTDLKTIERRNGWPFRLSAFAREGYPGEVLSWGNGRLKTVVRNGCSVRIYLLPQEGARTSGPRLPFRHREFSSGHPAIQELNPRVYQLLIYYPGR